MLPRKKGPKFAQLEKFNSLISLRDHYFVVFGRINEGLLTIMVYFRIMIENKLAVSKEWY